MNGREVIHWVLLLKNEGKKCESINTENFWLVHDIREESRRRSGFTYPPLSMAFLKQKVSDYLSRHYKKSASRDFRIGFREADFLLFPLSIIDV